MNNDTLNEIRKNLIDEAINSPLLLSDLANMEKYISDSYQGRSLIELLQNADDANATRFIILKIDSTTFLVANNGRPFDEDDVISICRSGASSKQRKSKSIGFRGIGFKSVVNYSNTVHILSDDVHLTFSRELSQKALNNSINVPLIRIPHILENYSDHRSIINQMQHNGYSTIFIFNISSAGLSEEILDFDPTTLLFLHNILEVNFTQDNCENKYYISRGDTSNPAITSVTNDNKTSKWLTFSGTSDCAISFKLDDHDKAMEIERDEALIHSFMPTKEYTNLPVKFNGDFSTDPTRTKVIMDEDTLLAINECVHILCDIVINVINQKQDSYSIIHLLSSIEKNIASYSKVKKVGELIYEEFITTVNRSLMDNLSENDIKISVQPKWIKEDDFIKICQENKSQAIGESIDKKIPNLIQFVNRIGNYELSLINTLRLSENLDFSIESRALIFAEFIKKYRFGFDESIKDMICNSRIIEFENGCKSIVNMKLYEKIHPSFYSSVLPLIDDEKDLLWVLRKLGLYNDSTGTFSITDKATMQNSHKNKSIPLDSSINGHVEDQKSNQFVTFKGKPSFQKWKSIEENVAIYFENVDGVVKVTNVSLSNLGYDLEVQWNNRITYVEIKSVSSLGDSFSMTNNEYSTAIEYKDDYYLAIVEQTNNDIKICLIQNPQDCLQLFKRVTRWEWVCNEYGGIVISTLSF